VHEQTDTVGEEPLKALGAEVFDVLNQATAAVLADAEAKARAIEEEAAERARRAAEAESRAHELEAQAAAHLERAAHAESRVLEMEEDARARAERAADEYESAAREDVKRARREALDAAAVRAAAMVNAAQDEAAQIRKRAMDELSGSRLRAIRETERAAEYARARLLKFADSAQEDLTALIVGIRKDAGGVGRAQQGATSGPRPARPWDEQAA